MNEAQTKEAQRLGRRLTFFEAIAATLGKRRHAEQLYAAFHYRHGQQLRRKYQVPR